MSEIDLSTLSPPELRGLLDATRRRGQASQSLQILQELAARRTDAPRKLGRKAVWEAPRGLQPRVISLNLGDPLEPQDDPLLTDAAPLPAPPEEAPLTLDPVPRTARAPRKPRRAPRMRPPRAEAAPPQVEARPPRRRLWVAAGFAAGALAGLTLGIGFAREALSPPEAPATVVAAGSRTLKIEAATPPQLTPAATAPVPAAPPPVLAEAPVTPNAAEAAVPASTGEDAAHPADEAKPVLAQETETADSAPAESKACAGAATPADKAICADAALQRLQGELRRAYAEALDAHADRALLRQHQLAWREARNTVSDPRRLTRLYETRIRKLNAATADARRQR